MHVPPCGINEHRAVYLVEGGVVVGNVEVAASAVAAFSDDDVDGSFDVGVVLVDGSGDVAVGNGGREVFSEAPLVWDTRGDFIDVVLSDRWG